MNVKTSPINRLQLYRGHTQHHTAQSTQSTLLLSCVDMPGAGEAAEAGGHQQCKLQLIFGGHWARADWVAAGHIATCDQLSTTRSCQ